MYPLGDELYMWARPSQIRVTRRIWFTPHRFSREAWPSRRFYSLRPWHRSSQILGFQKAVAQAEDRIPFGVAGRSTSTSFWIRSRFALSEPLLGRFVSVRPQYIGEPTKWIRSVCVCDVFCQVVFAKCCWQVVFAKCVWLLVFATFAFANCVCDSVRPQAM